MSELLLTYCAHLLFWKEIIEDCDCTSSMSCLQVLLYANNCCAVCERGMRFPSPWFITLVLQRCLWFEVLVASVFC